MGDGDIIIASEENENITSNTVPASSIEQEHSSSDESDTDTERNVEQENKLPNLNQETTSDKSQDQETTKKKRKRNQNKCLNCKQGGHLKKDCPELPEERRKELQELVQLKIERKGMGIGRKKNKKRK